MGYSLDVSDAAKEEVKEKAKDKIKDKLKGYLVINKNLIKVKKQGAFAPCLFYNQ